VVFFNYTTMQMTAKIVYYGPGLCGKTTNLQFIHHRTAAKSRGEMVSLETETDRTLFFDLLPLDVGVIGGMKVRLQLYTVPGQVFYNATRKLVLKGVDGIVFVADSQRAALDTNLESLANLKTNLRELGLADPVPIVLQYNKRDLRQVLSVDEMNQSLNTEGHLVFEAAALHGIGVFETLKAVSKLAITAVRQKLGPLEPRRGAAPAAPPARPAAPQPEAPPPEAPLLEVREPAATPTPRAPAPRAALSEIEALVSGSRAEELPVEFAEEDTGTHDVRAVQTKAPVDVHQELEKLRALAAAPAARASGTGSAPQKTDLDRRLKEMLTPEASPRQDLKRKASLEIPGDLLKTAASLRVQIAFTNEGDGETVHEALVIPLGGNRRLERVLLHLDLEIKGRA
jgi:mutual gliding-motility protein MglA